MSTKKLTEKQNTTNIVQNYSPNSLFEVFRYTTIVHIIIYTWTQIDGKRSSLNISGGNSDNIIGRFIRDYALFRLNCCQRL